MICRLCVNTCSDLKSFYDENGHGNELYQTTREYFHPKIVDMEKAKHLRGICAQCFQQIYAFNSFQASVRVAQLKLVFEGIHNIVTEEQHQTSVAPAQISNVQATPTEVVYNEALLPDDKQRNFEDLAVEHLGFSIKIKTEKDMLKDDKNPPVPNNVQNSQGEVFETRPNLEEYPTETTTSYDDEDKHQDKLKFECTVCGKRFKTPQGLQTHNTLCHISKISCKTCGKRFKTPQALNAHSTVCHESDSRTRNPFTDCRCTVCAKTLLTYPAFREHMAMHQDKDLYQCAFCPQTFRWFLMVLNHREEMHPHENKSEFYKHIEDQEPNSSDRQFNLDIGSECQDN